jgi:hypothetical protein
MSIDEKYRKIRDFCEATECDERGCPLYKTSFSDDGVCYEEHGSDQEIEKMYEILNDADVFKNDPVNHPSHYTDGKIEVIDYIEDKKLGFCLGNAVKYISRAGKKDPTKEVEDLKKALWYVERRIKELEEAG